MDDPVLSLTPEQMLRLAIAALLTAAKIVHGGSISDVNAAISQSIDYADTLINACKSN